MNNIKIVFFDIDGTLFKIHTNEMSSRTLETLQKLRANGIKICIATGRSPMGLPKFKGVEIATWWDKAVDIIPANGGKGMGIESVLNYYGFNKLEALAFGDGNNDIEMLLTVGTGVAMGNASEDLKAVADDVCRDVAEDGIYHYCKEHGLI